MTFNFWKYVKNGKRARENFKFRNYKEFQDYKKMWAVRFIFWNSYKNWVSLWIFNSKMVKILGSYRKCRKKGLYFQIRKHATHTL